ncbi:MAG: hypothetical protein JNL10_08115 [Verrucomicrobiales bacterium]|nr:hypothetical protein [Verrucomicrobiales bacterium]
MTVPLTGEDFDFLRAYSKRRGISAEALLGRQARNVRQHLQRLLHPEVIRATGILSPEVSGEEAHRGPLGQKHA